jgi:hypothetical protein
LGIRYLIFLSFLRMFCHGGIFCKQNQTHFQIRICVEMYQIRKRSRHCIRRYGSINLLSRQKKLLSLHPIQSHQNIISYCSSLKPQTNHHELPCIISKNVNSSTSL